MIGRLGKLGGVAVVAAGSFTAGSSFTDWKDSIIPYRFADATVAPARPSQVATADTPGLGPSRVSEIMKFGYPGFDNLRTFEDFVVSYDRKTRTAHWVLEHLTPERMVYDPSVDRSKCQFRPDESMHPYFRSLNEDYKGSGYDRGHLAAAGNHRKTQLSVDQTFLLSNMSPQVGRGFNRDKWNDLEKRMRNHAKNNPNVYVCTGPLYLPHQDTDGCNYVKYKVIGKSHVAVPTHFFKVCLVEKAPHQFQMECYVLPNQAIPNETPLSNFMVPLDAIERAAGFLIFEKVPKNELKMVNGKKVGGLW
uniref:Endonuclease n=1 Tax=Steinernema glaseri TaxID=37863 RepID=A0A1I7YGJ6_9BILA